MNLQSLIVVVLRLLALNFFLQGAIKLPLPLYQIFQISRQDGLIDNWPFLVIVAIVVMGSIVGAILLWVLALPIARFVTSGVSRDLSFGSMSLVDCYSIAFIGIGLFCIASHFPDVLNLSHYLLKAAAHSTPRGALREEVQWYEVSSAFVPFIIGLLLFVKGRSWAFALARKQQKSESPGQTTEGTGVSNQ